MGWRIDWVSFDRLLEVSDGLQQTLRRPLAPVEAPLEVRLVRVGLHRRLPGEPALLLRLKLDLDGLGNGPRQLPLKRQDVAQLALVAPRPQVAVGRRVDQ